MTPTTPSVPPPGAPAPERAALATPCRRAPVLCYALAFLVAAELLAALAAPMVVPEHVYLRLYLGKRARERTTRFLEGRDQFLVYDPVVGWRNRPIADRGAWRTDSLGSRSTHEVRLAPSTPVRVLFLGSSLVNGGTGVAADQTMSAFLEDSVTEAVNCGTMLHSLDQALLAYTSDLHRYRAHVIVVGLHADPADGLGNRYIPFRYPSETNVPYLKPRFLDSDTGPVLLPVPGLEAYRRILAADYLLDTLRATDSHYPRFARFAHLGLTPLAAGARYLYERGSSLVRLGFPDTAAPTLALALMERLEDEAARNGARVAFVLLPDRTLTFPNAWRRRLPDTYDRALTTIRSRGFVLLDGRAVLRRSGLPPERLYGPDAIHYTPEGNRILGGALKHLLTSGAEPATRDRRRH